MNSYTKKIAKLVGFKESKNEQVDPSIWEEVENRYGIAPPKDYKELFQFFGPGGFGPLGELAWFLSPSESVPDAISTFGWPEQYLEFFYQRIEDVEWVSKDFDIEDADEMDLFPWGYTFNRQYLYWGRIGTEHGVIIDGVRDPEAYFYRMSIPEFLYHLISNQLEYSPIPEDLWDQPITFHPYIPG